MSVETGAARESHVDVTADCCRKASKHISQTSCHVPESPARRNPPVLRQRFSAAYSQGTTVRVRGRMISVTLLALRGNHECHCIEPVPQCTSMSQRSPSRFCTGFRRAVLFTIREHDSGGPGGIFGQSRLLVPCNLVVLASPDRSWGFGGISHVKEERQREREPGEGGGEAVTVSRKATVHSLTFRELWPLTLHSPANKTPTTSTPHSITI